VNNEFSNRKRFQSRVHPLFSPIFLFLKQAHAQDRQCTHTVTLSLLRINIVAVEKLYTLHIVSACYIFSLVIRHANHIFSAPYYIVICGPSGCTVFFHIIS
jgi:hypothetical protein